MKNLLLCLTVVTLLTSCASSLPVQETREFAIIPYTFQTIPVIPPIPEKGTVTVREGINLANDLRSSVCVMRSRYRELLRYATGGNVVLPEASLDQCPKNIKGN